jgi:hypothetical protein
MGNEEVLHRVKDDGNILLNKKERRLTEFIISCLRPAIQNTIKGREYEEENVSSYWLILRKREDAGN